MLHARPVLHFTTLPLPHFYRLKNQIVPYFCLNPLLPIFARSPVFFIPKPPSPFIPLSLSCGHHCIIAFSLTEFRAVDQLHSARSAEGWLGCRSTCVAAVFKNTPEKDALLSAPRYNWHHERYTHSATHWYWSCIAFESTCARDDIFDIDVREMHERSKLSPRNSLQQHSAHFLCLIASSQPWFTLFLWSAPSLCHPPVCPPSICIPYRPSDGPSRRGPECNDVGSNR